VKKGKRAKNDASTGVRRDGWWGGDPKKAFRPQAWMGGCRPGIPTPAGVAAGLGRPHHDDGDPSREAEADHQAIANGFDGKRL